MGKKPKPHELRERATRVRLNLERNVQCKQLLPDRHLFVTEGTKTEPFYLYGLINCICNKLGDSAKSQFNVIGEGDNTLNLLSRAESYLQNSSDYYQHVWIIYDKDDFPADHFDTVAIRCEALNQRFQGQGRDLHFHAIWSNECFELWLLIHFDFLQANISREDYKSKLSAHLQSLNLGAYEKNRTDIFQLLYPRLNFAIKNAQRLEKANSGKTPSQSAPGTKLHELLIELKPYL